MQAGVVQTGLISLVLFSVYLNDIPAPSCHIELAQYVDNMALIAVSRSQLLFTDYLEAYLGRLELWLRDWRIAINILKSTIVLFVKAIRCSQEPRPVPFLGEPLQWIRIAHYLGLTLDTDRTWSAHVHQVLRVYFDLRRIK
jgi:hypothetical protein